MKQNININFIVLLTLLLALIVVPFMVISYGYLPCDDALRHAAKVLSEKNWNQILVLDHPDILDPHPGWHAILSTFRHFSGAGGDGLVIFSVVALFLIYALPPLFKAKHPESWAIAFFLIAAMNSSYLQRLMFGRPFLFSIFVLNMVCLNWQWFRERQVKPSAYIIFTALFATSCWIHGSWFLFLIIFPCFLIAGEIRAGLNLFACFVLGTIIGSAFTGHPAQFLVQTLLHAIHAMNFSVPKRLLVIEFKPFMVDIVVFFAMCLTLIFKKNILGKLDRSSYFSPLTVIIFCCGVLTMVSIRFWLDWGLPVVVIWFMLQIDDILNSINSYTVKRRLVTLVLLVPSLLICTSADIQSRWTYMLTKDYVTADIPGVTEWLPGKGGTIYSDSMLFFYETFYMNPKADWRYILGFEPAMMPRDDLKIYRKIQWNYGAVEAFEPWVKKMRPEDRLVIIAPQNAQPNLPGLEWFYITTDTWIGRKPKK